MSPVNSRKSQSRTSVSPRREDARHMVTVAALAGIVIAILVLVGRIPPDVALAGTGIGLLALIALALIALPPEDALGHLGRVKSLTLGSLGIELSDYESLAEKGDEDDDEGVEPGESLLDLRLSLEMKLTYLAKHVLATNPESKKAIPTFLTVGSLTEEKLLTPEQARYAEDILTMRAYEFRLLTKEERKAFKDGAKAFVDTVRIEVFAALLRKRLDRLGWFSLRLFPERSNRRDLLVQSKAVTNSTQHHVIPIFAIKADSSLLKRPHERLAKKSRAKAGGGRFIVVPPRSRAAKESVDPDGIRVLTLAQLIKILRSSGANGGTA